MDELSARRLRNVIPVLVEQRNLLVAGGVSFAGHLVDLAIMQLRLTLHEISEDELSEFSNVLSVGLKRESPIDPPGSIGMPGRRWIILAVLFAARAAIGFQFQSIGSAANLLMADLGIGYSEVGMLLGAYMLPGVIVAFPAGLLGSRGREKTLGLVGLVLMAVSGLALSYSGDLAFALVGAHDRRGRGHDRGSGRDQDGGGLVRRPRDRAGDVAACR